MKLNLLILTNAFNKMNKYLAILFLVVYSNCLFSQNENDNKLEISGKVTDYFTNQPVSGTSVKVTENGNYVNNVVCDGKGVYVTYVDFEKEYIVIYEKAGYVPKKVIVNLKGVPPDKRTKVNDLVIEMTIFKQDKDLNVSFLDQPIGKANYIPQTNEIDWNMGYTAPISQKLNQILDTYKSNLAQREALEKKKVQDYNAAMKDGDSYFFKKDFEGAKTAYQKAVSIDDSKQEPKDRLALIDTAIKKKIEAEKAEAEAKAKAEAEAKAKAEDLDALVVAIDCFSIRDHPINNGLVHGTNGGQRCAEIMRDPCNEGAAGLFQLAFLIIHLL